ncbi:hypothetical protein F7734_31060 [Scytonema sp. UIC 10036]|uniref:hypothetical protein n=1 Tax=Scytonema sp. UIC 10036 TaxID=2304196 RepID=UPI0012DA38DD|nr:hypothetical protein [Scytonema sp. UIC 10036]MUG96540.1 hypothetical protein [Scytonema sp. UIC 10036]
MDEIVKKLAGLGLPGIILVILTVSSGGSSAAVAAALTAWGGPFGIVGGIALLGLISVVGDVVAGFGVEALLQAIYSERSKTESIRVLLKEIRDLPITDELKLKLKNHLSPETTSTYPGTPNEPRTVEVVEE